MCIRCGAMKNDSVREELESSLMPISGPLRPRTDELIAPISPPQPAEVEMAERPRLQRSQRSRTDGLAAKKTDPTLAEFRNIGTQIPEWRLQLQNSVRQRILREEVPSGDAPAAMEKPMSPVLRPSAVSSGAAASVAFETEPGSKLSSALKRIEESRRAYLPTEKAREGIRVARDASRRFPFDVVHKKKEIPNCDLGSQGPGIAPRPKLVSSFKIEKRKYDTNKLVPIPEAEQMAAASVVIADNESVQKPLRENWSEKLEIKDFANEPEPQRTVEAEHFLQPEVVDQAEAEEIEDLAPISMRFNAGLFDAIAGSFVTGIVVSPFFAFSENWFSLPGVLLFVVAFAIVMFLYLTASIAYFGQTLGMRIFSLELIDVEASEYPSLHQAAVSSSVYLLSLAFGGLGFLPLLFNEERRAAHDLASGTILVRDI